MKPLPLTFNGEKKHSLNATEQSKKTRNVWLYVDRTESDDDADAGINAINIHLVILMNRC